MSAAYLLCSSRAFCKRGSLGPLLCPCSFEKGAERQNMLWGLWACFTWAYACPYSELRSCVKVEVVPNRHYDFCGRKAPRKKEEGWLVRTERAPPQHASTEGRTLTGLQCDATDHWATVLVALLPSSWANHPRPLPILLWLQLHFPLISCGDRHFNWHEETVYCRERVCAVYSTKEVN